MSQDTRTFVSSSVCARSKAIDSLPDSSTLFLFLNGHGLTLLLILLQGCLHLQVTPLYLPL